MHAAETAMYAADREISAAKQHQPPDFSGGYSFLNENYDDTTNARHTLAFGTENL